MFNYEDGTTKEENADRLERLNRTQNKRKNVVNICRARGNWNACDYIDYNKQAFSTNGQECWKQDTDHTCCHCVKIHV